MTGEGQVSSCALCDTRLAVVAVHRLADVALHVTLTRPFGEDARCLECCLDDLTRLVIAPARTPTPDATP